MSVDKNNTTTNEMKLPSAHESNSDHAHDSSGSNSPRSPVETLSWGRASLPSASSDIISAEGIDIDDTMGHRRSSCTAIGPDKNPQQRIFPARVSEARKQVRQYANDLDDLFSIVEEVEKEDNPKMTTQGRMPRSQLQAPPRVHKSLPARHTRVTSPILPPRQSRSKSPVRRANSPISMTISPRKKVSPRNLRRSQLHIDASAFQQPLTQPRQACFGSQREHKHSQKLVAERKKINDDAAAKPPKRLDSWMPPARQESKTEPGAPSRKCSVDEWSNASWTESPIVVDSKKTLI